jgi:hypothetical protein
VPRAQKYKSPTRQVTFRIPEHVLQGLDGDAFRKNKPRAEIVLELLIDKYGDKALEPVAPAARSVFD